LLLPAESRLKALAFAIEEERRHALDLTPRELGDEEGLLDEPPQERSPKGEGFEVLSSHSATLDGEILSETTMQLFAFEEPKAHAALEAFGGAIQRTQAIQAGTGAN